jgi:hypothetical protein
LYLKPLVSRHARKVYVNGMLAIYQISDASL